jgi:GT2 family glycosyltransferase
MRNLQLSIIIVNWNTSDYLKDCLSSIYSAISNELSSEAIVVDNNSADDSVKMIKEFFPQVRLIENRDNFGFAKANNQGYEIAKGDIIALLNPDTIVYQGVFERIVDYLMKNPSVGAASCRLLNPDNSLQQNFRRLPDLYISFLWYPITMRIIDRYLRNREIGNYYFYSDKDFNKIERVEQPDGSFIAFRRDVIERIGLFDENFPIFFNDVDLCKRIWDAGYEIHALPDIHITHYQGSTVKTLPRVYAYWLTYSGLYRYIEKYFGKKWGLLLIIEIILDFPFYLFIMLFKRLYNLKAR